MEGGSSAEVFVTVSATEWPELSLQSVAYHLLDMRPLALGTGWIGGWVSTDRSNPCWGALKKRDGNNRRFGTQMMDAQAGVESLFLKVLHESFI